MLRSVPILASLLVHGLMAGVVVSHRAPARAPSRPKTKVEIAVVSRAQEAPRKLEPPPPPPPPPPPARAASPRRAAPPPPAPAPPPMAARPAAPISALASGLVLGGTVVGGGSVAVATAGLASAAARPSLDRRARPAPTPPPAAPCADPVSKPKPTDKPRDIDYPADARARGVEGRLVLRVTVTAAGRVRDVVVVEPVDAAIDAAALEVVRTWTFSPATACGEPVESNYLLARRFELGE